jgi:hypothetical protein
VKKKAEINLNRLIGSPSNSLYPRRSGPNPTAAANVKKRKAKSSFQRAWRGLMTPGMKDAIKAFISRIVDDIGEQESGEVYSQFIVSARREL